MRHLDLLPVHAKARDRLYSILQAKEIHSGTQSSTCLTISRTLKQKKGKF